MFQTGNYQDIVNYKNDKVDKDILYIENSLHIKDSSFDMVCIKVVINMCLLDSYLCIVH